MHDKIHNHTDCTITEPKRALYHFRPELLIGIDRLGCCLTTQQALSSMPGYNPGQLRIGAREAEGAGLLIRCTV